MEDVDAPPDTPPGTGAGVRTSADLPRRPPRLENDPDRYIRVVRRGRYQARPIDMGIRYDLGLFTTRAEARVAIQEFWWGRRESLPRFTKAISTRDGRRYAALIPDPARPGKFVNIGAFQTRQEAAAAAKKWIAKIIRGFPKWRENATAAERKG